MKISTDQNAIHYPWKKKKEKKKEEPTEAMEQIKQKKKTYT